MARTNAKARPGSGLARSKRQSVGRKRQGPSQAALVGSWLTRLETFGILLISLGALGLLSLISVTRVPGLLDQVTRTVGLHSFTLSVALLATGFGVWRRQLDVVLGYPRYLAAVIPLLLFSAGLLSIFSPSWSIGGATLAEKSAGGSLGLALFAEPLGILIWFLGGIAFVSLVWPRTVAAALRRTPGALATFWSWRLDKRALHALLAVVDFAFPTKPPVDERPSQATPDWLPAEQDEDEIFEEDQSAASEPEAAVFEAPLTQVELPIAWSPEEATETPAAAATIAQNGWNLPQMDLLIGTPPPDESARPDNAMRSGLIVETLASFGVDARLADFHEGPVVTQFDVEPGWEIKYKQIQERDKDNKPILGKNGKPKTHSEEVSRTRVRVNQITSLANDLALALAAPSLRIEAPVPGRSVVGIEVPNTAASVVTLRSVIETSSFQRASARGKLTLPLGKSVSGEPVVADLAKMPHLLIAGATGSGKSVCINSVVASVLMHSKPEEVRFVMIDPKRVELSGFAMIPHLAFSSIVVDAEKVVGTLGAVLHEMEDRYKRFASLAVRNIDSYNKHPSVTEKLPYWVVIIDELADLMMVAPFEVERQICRLAQLARATGIHLIVATQRPSVDIVTGLIKANFPTRIAFAMTSQVDSRTILDMAGAERLLGRGDMLYMAPDSSKPKRVQGVYVSDQEIDRLVTFWESQRVNHSTQVFDHLLDRAQTEIQEAEKEDPMYERAKALTEEHSKVSTSMLQRRLRIGYPRAARMIDQLEEDGYLGDKPTDAFVDEGVKELI